MRRGLHKHLVVTSALLALCAPTISGQRSDSTHAPVARIIGIFDARTGDPLPGVQVLDVLSGTYAMTTVTGTARLTFLTFRGTAGFLELRKLGYEAKQLFVTRADTAPITEVMEPAVALAPVITTEQYRVDRDPGLWDGFEQRCQSKSVTCIRAGELQKRLTSNLADLLIHADGVTIGSCGGGGGGPGAARRNGQCGKIAMHSVVIPPPYCQPTFFVDGFEWNAHVNAPADLTPGRPAEAPYTPANVKAVEVYPPERPRPLRFQGDPTCGVVVIWTK